MSSKKIFLFVALAIISLGLAAFFTTRYVSESGDFIALQVLPTPKPMPPIALENHHGAVFSTEQFKHHWSLIFFGFTRCPDMCPLQLQQLNQLLQLVGQQPPIDLQVVFISLDPERDSREKIGEYFASFNSLMLGVRGTPEEVSALSQFFSVDYAHQPSFLLNTASVVPQATEAENNYQIVHSGRIFLIDPQARYVGSFAQPHNVESMWADLRHFIK